MGQHRISICLGFELCFFEFVWGARSVTSLLCGEFENASRTTRFVDVCKGTGVTESVLKYVVTRKITEQERIKYYGVGETRSQAYFRV